MRIEPYTEERRGEILNLVKTFWDESLYRFGQRLDEKAINNSIDNLKSHSFLLIINNQCVGVFAGIETQTPLNFGKVFHQVIWYVKEEYRGKSMFFLKRVIKTLKDCGYESVVITLLPGKELRRRSKFFKKLQFKPLEVHFIRSLNARTDK